MQINRTSLMTIDQTTCQAESIAAGGTDVLQSLKPASLQLGRYQAEKRNMAEPLQSLEKLKRLKLQPDQVSGFPLKGLQLNDLLPAVSGSKIKAGYFAVEGRVPLEQLQHYKIFFDKHFTSDTNFKETEGQRCVYQRLEERSVEIRKSHNAAHTAAFQYYESDEIACAINTALRCFGRDDYLLNQADYEFARRSVDIIQSAAFTMPKPIIATRVLVYEQSCGMAPNAQALTSLSRFLTMTGDKNQRFAEGCIIKELGFSSTKPTDEIHGELADRSERIRFNIVLEKGVPCFPISEELDRVEDLILMPGQQFLVVRVANDQAASKNIDVDLVALQLLKNSSQAQYFKAELVD